MHIREDDPRNDQAARLLREHLDDMQVHSPPESIHALDVEALCSPEIIFWTAWDGDDLLGCGALLELDAAHGTAAGTSTAPTCGRNMRTARDHLRKGVASGILQHIITEAERRAYRRLSLETGSMAAFAPARALYTRFGFSPTDPFADYVLDPNSVFMTRAV